MLSSDLTKMNLTAYTICKNPLLCHNYPTDERAMYREEDAGELNKRCLVSSSHAGLLCSNCTCSDGDDDDAGSLGSAIFLKPAAQDHLPD